MCMSIKLRAYFSAISRGRFVPSLVAVSAMALALYLIAVLASAALRWLDTSWLTPNGTVVALVVAGAAVWYTIETTQLRMHAERQSRFMERQSTQSLMPFLAGSVSTYADVMANEDVSNELEVVMGLQTTTAGRQRLQVQQFKERMRTESHQWMNVRLRQMACGEAGPERMPTPKMVVVVDNPTHNVALSLWAIWYDAGQQRYAASGDFSDFVGPREAAHFAIDTYDLSLTEVSDRYSRLEPGGLRWLGELSGLEFSFIAVAFSTLDGTQCLLRRRIVVTDDGTVLNGNSKLFW